jgi:SH3-like domain-containing protein
MGFRFLAVFWRLCLTLGLLSVSGERGWSQSQSDTLQAPTHQKHDGPVMPPQSAPRQAVHQVGPPGSPPVVSPHGQLHPHKPSNSASRAPSSPSQAGTPQSQKPQAQPETAPPATDAQAASQAATTEKLPDPDKQEGAVAKLPRFASLRSDDVNMRLGPGTRYRIDWVYKRRDLPVEIEREYEVWRWVSDPDGNRGWVHQATLMGRRNFIVQKADATLRSDPADTASAVAILQPGVIGRVRSCEAASEWCNVQAGSYRGFLRRQQFWGVLPGEAIAP